MAAKAILFIVLALAAAAPASAAGTLTYTYDALGRLIQVRSAGGINDGITTSYAYDRAGNRTSVVVTGAASRPVSRAFTIVPIGRYKVIVIPKLTN
jgi:YD repeat-containing protein